MAQPAQVHHVGRGRSEFKDFVDIDTGQSLNLFFATEALNLKTAC